MKLKFYLYTIAISSIILSCVDDKKNEKLQKNPKQKIQLTAKDILGNPNYLAISYGGYRKSTRGIQPTVAEIKEDLKILHAMKIKILRTYNVQLAQAETILKAIHELKSENPSFEMYVMLGAWIDCENAWTNQPVNHQLESDQNESEIARAVSLANKYPSIVKIIAVGNEAMVKWATSYYVQPSVILKWVSYLQNLKKENKLPKSLWITSSDNFASWGGGSDEYHTEDLNKLIKEVDYISMHTYPMHDTHYNPVFWYTKEEKPNIEKVNNIMLRARDYAVSQYDSVANYVKSLGIKKPIHIGETGWASFSNGLYGNKGSKATDEYKEALFYRHMREWTAKAGISCFYFEAFDEVWKDAPNPKGSENHFGLFTIDGKAKFALWDIVDEGVFDGLGRNKNSITKTYNGNKDSLLLEVHVPPFKKNNSTL
ncbi:MAG: glycosyl hydrolase family 17 protein [Flavobacteriaceae bacterium]|nr:glycosyl hydrolase family 17 protein [Flavobacteriaceae bacterium]